MRRMIFFSLVFVAAANAAPATSQDRARPQTLRACEALTSAQYGGRGLKQFILSGIQPYSTFGHRNMKKYYDLRRAIMRHPEYFTRAEGRLSALCAARMNLRDVQDATAFYKTPAGRSLASRRFDPFLPSADRSAKAAFSKTRAGESLLNPDMEARTDKVFADLLDALTSTLGWPSAQH